MKQIFLLFTLPCLLITAPSPGKGHGGGHGGGGHSHSHSGNARSSNAGNNSGSAHAAAKRNTAQAKARSSINRSTSPAALAASHQATARPYTKNGSVLPRNNEPGGNVYPGYGGYYGGAYPYYGYNTAPVFYDPYYAPFAMYYGFMYSPSYYPVNSPNYAGNGDNNNETQEQLDGFVVFEHDTLSGFVTIKPNTVLLDTRDSGKDYDYKFKIKNKGLEYVTVYNDDNKQLNLLRLNNDEKKLFRLVHIGKLNIYDQRHGFIYNPEDIDIKTLAVSYNGEIASLNSSSVKEAKEWLTQYVNRAYGSNLDPKAYSWKGLLIYIDKLD